MMSLLDDASHNEQTALEPKTIELKPKKIVKKKKIVTKAKASSTLVPPATTSAMDSTGGDLPPTPAAQNGLPTPGVHLPGAFYAGEAGESLISLARDYFGVFPARDLTSQEQQVASAELGVVVVSTSAAAASDDTKADVSDIDASPAVADDCPPSFVPSSDTDPSLAVADDRPPSFIPAVDINPSLAVADDHPPSFIPSSPSLNVLVGSNKSLAGSESEKLAPSTVDASPSQAVLARNCGTVEIEPTQPAILLSPDNTPIVLPPTPFSSPAVTSPVVFANHTHTETTTTTASYGKLDLGADPRFIVPPSALSVATNDTSYALAALAVHLGGVGMHAPPAPFTPIPPFAPISPFSGDDILHGYKEERDTNGLGGEGQDAEKVHVAVEDKERVDANDVNVWKDAADAEDYFRMKFESPSTPGSRVKALDDGDGNVVGFKGDFTPLDTPIALSSAPAPVDMPSFIAVTPDTTTTTAAPVDMPSFLAVEPAAVPSSTAHSSSPAVVDDADDNVADDLDDDEVKVVHAHERKGDDHTPVHRHELLDTQRVEVPAALITGVEEEERGADGDVVGSGAGVGKDQSEKEKVVPSKLPWYERAYASPPPQAVHGKEMQGERGVAAEAPVGNGACDEDDEVGGVVRAPVFANGKVTGDVEVPAPAYAPVSVVNDDQREMGKDVQEGEKGGEKEKKKKNRASRLMAKLMEKMHVGEGKA